MKNKKFSSIEKIIKIAKKGGMYILVDDENRENEGDFIAAAECVTPEMINFMAQHGRGLICTPITCLLYTSPSPRDGLLSRMPSSA